MLCDHGCDCVTCWLVGMTLLRILNVGKFSCLPKSQIKLGDNIFTLIGLIAVSTTFYFTTLESYYVGGLHLPMINGVVEGSIVIFAL